MAYRRKYYKSISSKGYTWTLEIYQDTEFAIAAVEIGPVLQSLRLIVQGDQADIDTPIVKTSLEMTFVDAPNVDPGKKCGYWEEFYTSSATEYKVILYKNGTIEWQGYITPDSFSETLQYRGSVTIIARDNLGALQDYEYDLDAGSTGMVSFSNLLEHSMDVISFPMIFNVPSGGVRRIPYTEHESALSILFNTEAFKGKTWQEVIESVLTSLGMVMRYTGTNKWVVSSIADIPLFNYNYWMDVPTTNVQFVAYATRELSPAVKKIVEEVTFDIEEDIAETDMPSEAYGDVSYFTFYRLMEQSGSSSNPTENIPVHAVVGGSLQTRTADLSLAFNALNYPLKEGHSSRKQGDIHDPSRVYIAANGGINTADDNRDVEYRLLVGPGTYDIGFTLGTPIALYDEFTKVGHIDVDVNLTQLKVLLNYESVDGTIQKRYDVGANKWVSGVATKDNTGYLYPDVAFPYTLSFATLTAEANGYISIAITRVSASQLKVVTPESQGMYIPLEDISVTDKALETTAIPDKMKVTTKFNEKNNILLQRKPDFGFNSGDVASPKIVRNGMYIPIDDWYESSDEWMLSPADNPNPYPVLVHQQMLAYYSKPNNVLSGEMALRFPRWDTWYYWNGAQHILTSGTLNIISGRMENVVLREFKQFGQVWGTIVSKDFIEMPRAGGNALLTATSIKDLTSDDVHSLPSWITASVSRLGTVSLTFSANQLRTTRTRTIYIDNAPIFVKQLGAAES